MKTEAQKRANRKYDSAHYKTLAYKCKLSDMEKIQEYAKSQNINTNSLLIHKCVMYCIENEVQLNNNAP